VGSPASSRLCFSFAVEQSHAAVSFQLKLRWKMQSRSMLDAAAADGFVIDRTKLELLGSKALGSAYAVDVRLLAQQFHCLCLLLFL